MQIAARPECFVDSEISREIVCPKCVHPCVLSLFPVFWRNVLRRSSICASLAYPERVSCMLYAVDRLQEHALDKSLQLHFSPEMHQRNLHFNIAKEQTTSYIIQRQLKSSGECGALSRGPSCVYQPLSKAQSYLKA